MSHKTKLLVTGGAGYLGQRVVTEALHREFEVAVLDKLPNKENLARFIEGDIRDKKILDIATRNIDTVIHCVGLVPLAKNKKENWNINVVGTKNLIEIAQKNKVKNFIFISSSAVYGKPKSLPIFNTSERNPIESYGQAKMTAENIVTSYRNYGMNVTIVRPRTIIGKNRLGIFSLLFELISSDIDVPIFGDGKNRYQFIHIDDLVNAILAAVEKELNCDLNLGALNFQSMGNELNILINTFNSKSKLLHLPRNFARISLLTLSKLKILPFAEYQIQLYGENMFFDCSKDWRTLGIQPQYSNLDGLISSFQSFLSNESKMRKGTKKSIHTKGMNSLSLISLLTFLRIVNFGKRKYLNN